VSRVWDAGTTRVERRTGLAGRLLEDWCAAFPEAIRFAVACEQGRRVRVVRDRSAPSRGRFGSDELALGGLRDRG
jgi:hypothetical protein